MIEIRKARDGEECQVLYFYYRLVDTMKGTPYCPKWEKGIYPVLSDIAGAIGANTLYIATENHESKNIIRTKKNIIIKLGRGDFIDHRRNFSWRV